MALPKMVRIRQHFPRPVVRDVAQAVRDEIHRLNLSDQVQAGETVAITAGSRAAMISSQS